MIILLIEICNLSLTSQKLSLWFGLWYENTQIIQVNAQSKGDSPKETVQRSGIKIAEWQQNSKGKKTNFGPRGHLTDYLPTLRGQTWTFD